MRMFGLLSAAVALAVCLVLTQVHTTYAHQPYFEDEDFTVDAAFRFGDPTVSTAVYGTLSTATDVDYFSFEAEAGRQIHLGLVIPAIAGQAQFNPTIALLGPGLPAAELPAVIDSPPGVGAVILRDQQSEPSVFFEPFSRTRYWERQDETVTLPVDGEYAIAVWHEEGATGRYTFVIGQREVLGGDPLFMVKLRSFWTPVDAADADAGARIDRSLDRSIGERHHDRFHAWLEHMFRCVLEFFAKWMPQI